LSSTTVTIITYYRLLYCKNIRSNLFHINVVVGVP